MGMASGTELAIDQATRLSEIGFEAFTAKLVTDVFDALVGANVRQAQAYADMVTSLSKSLKDYVNDTHDAIGAEEIMGFLAKVLPTTDPKDGPSKVKVNNVLSPEEKEALLKAIELKDEDGGKAVQLPQGALTEAAVASILDAVARRIAANKYDLLVAMTKQGVVRLVIEGGRIETKLSFSTYGSTYAESFRSNFEQKGRNWGLGGETGSGLAKWIRLSGSIGSAKLAVSTARQENRDSSGSDVRTYGHVMIRFRTDYQPLG